MRVANQRAALAGSFFGHQSPDCPDRPDGPDGLGILQLGLAGMDDPMVEGLAEASQGG